MKVFFLFLCLSFQLSAQEITPTEAFNQSLVFADDLQFENMDTAIERQLKSYKQMGLDGTIQFGNTVYPRTVLKDSLLLLQKIFTEVRSCLKSNPEKACLDFLNKEVNKKFSFFRPVPGKDEQGYGKYKTRFTSYYSPDFNGSRVRTDRFTRPIYRTPDNELDKRATRVEIDFHGALAGKGYEILWVEESFYELYLLHVQGGGRIKIHAADGSYETKYLSYDSGNGQPFQMLYKYMVEKGYIKIGSIPNQRKYLAENPHKQEEIFGICPSYIFFRESDEEPVGVNSIPLTEGRSLAIDIRIFKTVGLINFVRTVRATGMTTTGTMEKAPFSRFFIAQDTGGAIRGNARCDLYAGYGQKAELMAYNMDDLGEQYFLISK
ncbi:MAG TPA: MltA domain-containing protein [Bacteriovoracaceae bacterium]|nr:MltA domain-containing protein [Bacteriovoracaceae bacterium]